MGVANWQRRFAVLENNKFYLYEGDKTKEMEEARKSIDLSKVQCVCFHYDERAPVKSRKLATQGIDQSRFDIYTIGRIYHVRSEESDARTQMKHAQDWVDILQNAAAHYNPKYDRKFLSTDI